MIHMSIAEAARLLGCEAVISPGSRVAATMVTDTKSSETMPTGAESPSAVSTDTKFTGITTDSRQVVPGMLFAALAGANFDGHDYIEQAIAAGAVGVIVSRDASAPVPVLQVQDMLAALAVLAKHWRQHCPVRCVGITGSNGKTTVKEMVAGILRRCGKVLATDGNFNNELGLPLTLFRLDPSHDYAVIEMGASHLGDIAYLADIALPEVGLVTNIGRAHLQGFGSVENVARTKGEVFAALPAEGTAIMNFAEPWLELWKDMNCARSIQYFNGEIDTGSHNDKQVSAERAGTEQVSVEQVSADQLSNQQVSDEQASAGQIRPAQINAGQANDGQICELDISDFHGHITAELVGQETVVCTPVGKFSMNLPLPGTHNLSNALAATAVCLALDVPLDDIKAGLESVKPVPGRLNLISSVSGWTVIDDTYNANPASLYAALQVLSTQDGEPWLVLGDMKELGNDSRKMHAELGDAARIFGVKRLYALGEACEATVDAFGKDAFHYDNRDALIKALCAELHSGVACLVKGSRSMGMEHVVRAISNKHTCLEALG